MDAADLALLCCPRCRGDLAADGSGIRCAACSTAFPVIDGIPDLLLQVEDEVSRSVSEFYSHAWKRNESGITHGKAIHEDNSPDGQHYLQRGELRILGSFERASAPGRVFLDAACGAQPRVEFGRRYQRHLCVDFSFDGLAEARAQLGDRGIYVRGSLLQLPVKDGVCDGIMASHCIYHVGREEQPRAIAELLRVLAPGGTMQVLYANPTLFAATAPRHRLFWRARRLGLRLKARIAARSAPVAEPGGGTFLYTFLHPMEEMMRMLASGPRAAEVTVETLCVLSREESEPLMRGGKLGRKAVEWAENRYAGAPDAAYFLSYMVRSSA